MNDPKPYDQQAINHPDWLSTRGFEVFERAGEYRTAVIDRMHRAAKALDDAGIRYAVAGGNAVAAWVASVDPAAVRATQNVDILIRREDFEAVKAALESAGFLYRHAASLDFFIDGPDGRARDGIHLIFAGELVRPEHLLPSPDLSEIYQSYHGYYITTLQDIVKMKLVSNRRKDQVHLDDMISVGLIDRSWLETLPAELIERLRYLLENPEE